MTIKLDCIRHGTKLQKIFFYPDYQYRDGCMKCLFMLLCLSRESEVNVSEEQLRTLFA